VLPGGAETGQIKQFYGSVWLGVLAGGAETGKIKNMFCGNVWFGALAGGAATGKIKICFAAMFGLVRSLVAQKQVK
jgi:hypothetical protein